MGGGLGLRGRRRRRAAVARRRRRTGGRGRRCRSGRCAGSRRRGRCDGRRLGGRRGNACVVAVLWAFFLWCTFFLWCCFLALWCVTVVLVVSAARCCLDLCVLVFDEPPHPAIATAAATVNTSARFIAPLRSLEDVDSGPAMLAQMLRRSLGSVRRPSTGHHPQNGRTTPCRQKRQHDYHLAGVARGRLRRPRWKLLTCTCIS